MRVIDTLLSLFAVLLCLPLLLFIFLFILFTSGNPIFSQTRVGYNQRPFTIYKFRTMKEHTKWLPTHETPLDVIIKGGYFLRRSRLDELPQLLNVIKGDMSLVGPRPCLASQTELIELRNKRGCYEVKPGITGLSQLNNIDMSFPKSLAKVDQLMVRKFNICFYFAILFKTMIRLIR